MNLQFCCHGIRIQYSYLLGWLEKYGGFTQLCFGSKLSDQIDFSKTTDKTSFRVVLFLAAKEAYHPVICLTHRLTPGLTHRQTVRSQASDQKTSFTRCFTFFQRILKLILKTGNGIISPTSSPLIKKLILQNVSHFHQEVHN